MMPLLDAAGGGLAVAGRLLTALSLGLVAGGLVLGARTSRALGDDPWAGRLARTMLHAVLLGGALAAVAAAVRVFAQGLAFAADGDALGPILWLVVRTTWGVAALVQALLGCTLLLAAAIARRWSQPADRLGETQFVYPALGLLLTPAFMGHAAADPFLAVAVPVDALHLAGASVWGGGVALLAWVAMRDEGRARLARLIAAFHGDAVAAVTAVVLTGGIAAWRRLPDPWAPLATSYGRLLALKAALVVPVLLLGWWHARRGPAATEAGATRRLSRTLLLEAGAFALVWLATALLTGLSPED